MNCYKLYYSWKALFVVFGVVISFRPLSLVSAQIIITRQGFHLTTIKIWIFYTFYTRKDLIYPLSIYTQILMIPDHIINGIFNFTCLLSTLFLVGLQRMIIFQFHCSITFCLEIKSKLDYFITIRVSNRIRYK